MLNIKNKIVMDQDLEIEEANLEVEGKQKGENRGIKSKACSWTP